MIDRSIARKVRRRKLTYLGLDKLDSLYNCIDIIQKSDLPGDFTEFGVALGGSGICLAHALNADRRYFGFDVFSLIPPPSDMDGQSVHDRYDAIKSGTARGIGGDRYYGYIDDLYDIVKNNFSSFGRRVDDEKVFLVKGLFHDTLPKFDNLNISLAHIDCDWYEPVSFCLNYVWPRLSTEGFIILDDYNDWDGCKTAAGEFISSHENAELTQT